ncbi:MAG: AAA family ATPase [Paludibacteraceae bacterium]|nr:AAA family ATPase [Paludibacteraceae bacterium]
MNTLIETYRLLINRTNTDFIRYLHDKINWENRLVAILGARGTGKTTLVLQHIKMSDEIETSLYVTADDFYFTTHRLFELAKEFYHNGGKKLYIDEIHKYDGWSSEIKNIYDLLPDLRVVYTGSSILDLEQGGADLSRRKVEYHLKGLSFREYLCITLQEQFPSYTLKEVINGKVAFPYEKYRPLALFKQYLKGGYYPFFIESDDYILRLKSVLKQVVEFDIPTFAKMNITSSAKLKKLLYVVAQSVPFKPNFSVLERELGISRNILPDYLMYLEKAQLIAIIREKATGIKVLQKIDKIYLNNPNLSYALADSEPNIGTIRENIFIQFLQDLYPIVSSPTQADFEVNDYTFEVGGKNKTSKQIKAIEESYIVKDDIEYATLRDIPLWMFGFLY